MYKCTICGRVGEVGRCCGDETRVPWDVVNNREIKSFRTVDEEINYPRMPVYTAKEYDELKARAEKAEADFKNLEVTKNAWQDKAINLEAEVESLKEYLEWCEFHVNMPSREKYSKMYESPEGGE